MEIARKYFIGKILVLFALTANAMSLAGAAEDQPFTYGEDFQIKQSISGGKIYGHEFNPLNTALLKDEGVKVGVDSANNIFDLVDGNVLFAPDKPIVVQGREGTIHIAAGAIVFAMQSKDGLVIYDLRQGLPKQVKVSVDKHDIFGSPGYVIVLTRENVSSFEKLPLDCHSIIYRNPREIVLAGSKIKAFIAEYSISAGILTIVPLRHLIASKDKQDKTIFEKIMHAAAGLDDFLGPLQPSQLANMSRQL